MGLFDRFKKATGAGGSARPAAVDAQAGADVVCAPVDGRVVPMVEVPDSVFAGEVMGPGCGIWPTGETAYAPVSGTVSVTMGHAVGITSADGVELIIHVGIDTVEMDGRGFTVYVEKGDHVEAGQPILGFSRHAIADAGYRDIVVTAVTNGGSFSSVELSADSGSQVAAGAAVLRLVR